MHRNRFMRALSLSALLLLLISGLTGSVNGQGVTTAALNGVVVDQNGQPLVGCSVMAVHTPSGTIFGAATRADGRFNIPGVRVGGPYTITASLIGYRKESVENIFLGLGEDRRLTFTLVEEALQAAEVTVVAERDAILSASRTGAATAVSSAAIQMLPTITRNISDFTRLTPQASGNSFVGQDNRFNNITVDGSYFNNSFGLAGSPGERTGVAPISLDAIEQIQVNIAPYDVRQGNFVGAGVNTVTKSGTNEFSGSAYYQFRNDGLYGTKAGDLKYQPGTFDYKQIGLRLGGPLIKNKLFFFGSFEDDELTRPGTDFTANLGGETVGGNKTRVLASDLNQLSSFLKEKFGYETGGYQGYDFKTPALRFIGKVDFNLNEHNKLSLRYNHLDSETDVLVSNSSSLGFGNRRTNTNALNFQNSNYKILENIRSIVGEWNSILGPNMSNNLLIGYTHNDESRKYVGSFFPMVDILKDGSTYTTFGFEPFTPNNELRYWSFQVQNNFTYYRGDHNFTFGLSGERYESENVFFPGSQSIYVYNSLEDFYRDANDYLANPNRTTSPVTLRRFQVRWTNIPGQTKPIQPLEVLFAGVYGQDEWQVNKNLRLTLGLRVDVPFFGDTGFKNPQVDGLSFRDEKGNTVKYSTDKLPDSNLLWSPRLGFNWDVSGDRSTQVRGGTGIFTGRPAYVWISNQIGNNGILTGFEQLDNTTARPFHPDPNHYKKPATGAPAASYELAFTDPKFKFPQLWRSNLAVDRKLPWFGLIGTAEFLYNRDVNGIYYINANLKPADTKFNGPDQRPRWTAGNRINSNITSAIVLKNQNEGYSWNFSASVERAMQDGLYGKLAYSYGVSKNTVDPGSIAFGSWNNNQHAGDPNNPGVAFSANSPGHRILAVASYRREYFNFGATTISLVWEGARNWPADPFAFASRSASYTYSGDLNGDGGTSNDLIYIPRDKSEMNFEEFTSSGKTFTVLEQQEAWEAFIQQDPYLSKHRGQYAERGAIHLPMVYRADLSITQDLFTNVSGKRNGLQFRVDLLNVGNLINKNWGVGQRLVTTQPLIARGADAEGKARYRLRNIGTSLISKTYEPTATENDVFRIQFSLRYSFN
ncbi:MAG: carboxypeptidase regulatory-like domain-containing protein [candidate division KSB1 bacterium]|nr:carboxypeptidase regulatory-like domain-containing protein [candidate division KSB1 bacterium]MDZ7286332.1 carboxypeptidase regulatory-like domain-containing protein [candidate division KSB1 bacterium]MDZ7296560.1 carboxypeptidase regulatory-like domain-containing protein [candidate division KSB1 bacterium]MDZ7306093.1 carboxypeptidase regulatory-like domain-containing protein [candidate division KSB1 bacterium]MDZ7347426.1 carboxypeptidase regulatory-like domain-containing protein [candidat